MPTIPEPEYVADLIDGRAYTLTSGTLLCIGTPTALLAETTPTASGPLVVRYGISVLSPPGAVIVPGLLAAEKGGLLVGREAWKFMQMHFQMHPRADVVGLDLHGKRAQYFLRELDFGVSARVFLYASQDSTIPAAELNALYAGENPPEVAPLLAQYLPRVNDLGQWMDA